MLPRNPSAPATEPSGGSRRDLLRKGAGALAAAAIPGALPFAAAALAAPAPLRKRTRPNILFIAIDDMNDWTGWQGGYPIASTPNLDRLAGIGAAMHRARAPVPVCQGSRNAILFGMQPHDSGLYTNTCADWLYNPKLSRRTSLVAAFKEQGYTTVGTGKIHHTGWRDCGPDLNPGSWSDYLTHPDWADDGKSALVWACKGDPAQTEDRRRANLVADIFSRPQKNLFMAFGVRKPHMKWIVPDAYCKRYPLDKIVYPLGAMDRQSTTFVANDDFDDLGPAARAMAKQHHKDHQTVAGRGEWKEFVRAYLACISEADDAIGVAVRGVLEGPNADDTIIVVWSDHGWQLGEKLTWRKFTLWERALRVPVIFAGKGVRKRASRDPFSTIDLYETLTELAGIDPPSKCAGVSHAAYLRGEGGPARSTMLSTWALDVATGGNAFSAPRDVHFSVADARYSLIQYGTGEQELYDHQVDPWEWVNIADRKSSRDVITRLKDALPSKPVDPVSGRSGGDD